MTRFFKRYFITNQLKNYFPSWFSGSSKRWIVALKCKFVDSTTGDEDGLNDIMMHSSIIQDENYLDSFVFFCNNGCTDQKKFEQFSSQRSFKIWFTDMNGVKIPTQVIHDDSTNRDIERPTASSATREVLIGYNFVLELLLVSMI
jgi:hypothetical protein